MAQSNSTPDSLSQKQRVVYQPKPVTGKSFILPLSLIATGALGASDKFITANPEVKEERDENFRHFHTSLDNYLQFAPVVAGYGMLVGNKEHHLLMYTEKVLMTELLVTATIQPVKHITHVKRPDGSPYSFPSGHTAQAFAGAVLFSDEFARHKPWLAIMAYTDATAVGILRILNNRHWASDVVAGAGFGMLSAKASEWMVDRYNRKHSLKHSCNYQF